jgi:hypothetical protein
VVDPLESGRIGPLEGSKQRRDPEATVGTQRDQDNAEHRHEGEHHVHPDYARGERHEEPNTGVPDFARGLRHGEADEHEGTFASGPGEGPVIPADHGDFARGERHVDPI